MVDLIRFGTALVLGLVHSIDLDHVIAASTFLGQRSALPAAIRYGVRWGIGHSIAILAAGILVLALGLQISPQFEQLAEIAVGVMLIALGIMAFRALRNLHLHGPPTHGDQAHLHAHGTLPVPNHAHSAPASRLNHPRRPIFVGLLHGLAGSSGAVAIIPVAMIGEWRAGLGYLVVFCLGVTLGMVLFAVSLTEALRRTRDQSVVWGRRTGAGIALASIATGGYWIASALQ